MRSNALHARPRRCRLPAETGKRSASELAANLLDRQFEAPAPNRTWLADFTYMWTAEGWLFVAVVLELFWCRGVGWSMSATMTAELGTSALNHGRRATWSATRTAASFRSRQLVQQRPVPAADGRARHPMLAVASRQRLGQRSNGELLLDDQDRARGGDGLPFTGRCPSRCVRLNRAVLQSPLQAFDARLTKPSCLRGTTAISLNHRPSNRQQLITLSKVVCEKDRDHHLDRLR